METFSALLALCAGNSPVTGEFPSQRPVMQSFDVLYNLRLNKQLSKQWWSWWFEMPSRSLWCHSNYHMWNYGKMLLLRLFSSRPVDESASHDQVAHKIGYFYISLLFQSGRSQLFPSSWSQNQVELGERATGHFMHCQAFSCISIIPWCSNKGQGIPIKAKQGRANFGFCNW